MKKLLLLTIYLTITNSQLEGISKQISKQEAIALVDQDLEKKKPQQNYKKASEFNTNSSFKNNSGSNLQSSPYYYPIGPTFQW